MQGNVRKTSSARRQLFYRCPRALWLLPGSVALLLAADPSWKNKQIPSWTQEEARQILTDSPWSRTVTAGLTRLQSEDERRDGGNMGQSHGAGFDGVGQKQVRPRLDAATVFTKVYTPHAAEFVQLLMRWETALPIRAAELKAGEIDPPTLEGDGYKLAVYGVPGAYFKADPKKLGDPLKKEAVVKREGKPDVKPSRVEVFQRPDGLVVVYLFPLSAEFSRKDKVIEFDAQIGRVVVRQSFNLAEMEFQGNLEL
jgi:hypothetical protein